MWLRSCGRIHSSGPVVSPLEGGSLAGKLSSSASSRSWSFSLSGLGTGFSESYFVSGMGMFPFPNADSLNNASVPEFRADGIVQQICSGSGVGCGSSIGGGSSSGPGGDVGGMGTPGGIGGTGAGHGGCSSRFRRCGARAGHMSVLPWGDKGGNEAPCGGFPMGCAPKKNRRAHGKWEPGDLAWMKSMFWYIW